MLPYLIAVIPVFALVFIAIGIDYLIRRWRTGRPFWTLFMLALVALYALTPMAVNADEILPGVATEPTPSASAAPSYGGPFNFKDPETRTLWIATFVGYGLNYVDTRETRYFLTHGQYLCSSVFINYSFTHYPPGTLCISQEFNIVAKPFVGNNATAYGSMIVFDLASTIITHGLDQIRWLHEHKVMGKIVIGGDGIEAINDGHNLSITTAQRTFFLKTAQAALSVKL